MKKILVFLLILCMTLPVLSGCGSDNYIIKQNAYYIEQLIEALDAGDKDAVEDIRDEIKDFGADNAEVLIELEEKYQKRIEDLRDEYGDEAVDEAVNWYSETYNNLYEEKFSE